VELLSLLLSVDPKDRKDAMQLVCTFLEQGGRLRLDGDVILSSALAQQRGAKDPVTRRWFYKYVGLSRNVAYLPFLRKSLETETDQQALAWLLGAIVAISSKETALSYIKDRDVPDDIVNRVHVFASYFQREALEGDGVRRLIDDDHPLALRWVSFLRGRWQQPFLKGRVRELNSHPDPEVAEFSIWSLSQSGAGFQDSSVDPDELAMQPASVRRWSYYLIAADTHARIAYSDLIVNQAQAESDERAREGLARGLVAGNLRGQWIGFAHEWAHTESSDRVRRALERGLIRQPVNSGQGFEDVRKAVGSGILAAQKGCWMPSKRRSIDRVNREILYVWAVDTVSYSEMDDDAQLSVVRALMNEINDQEPLASLQPSSIVYLFTGDGMIVVVRGAARPRDIFTAALDFTRRCRKVYGFEVRMGINSGSGLVLQLSDSSLQVIGNTVNNTVRVMTSAAKGGLTVSGAYYDDAFQGGRVSVPGVNFISREASDKHGNILRLYDVVEESIT
jgi:class 3 adenylate cyclase